MEFPWVFKPLSSGHSLTPTRAQLGMTSGGFGCWKKYIALHLSLCVWSEDEICIRREFLTFSRFVACCTLSLQNECAPFPLTPHPQGVFYTNVWSFCCSSLSPSRSCHCCSAQWTFKISSIIFTLTPIWCDLYAKVVARRAVLLANNVTFQ